MDIKSKKSSFSAKLIITLVILISAFLLVALYPRMEALLLEEKARLEEEMSDAEEGDSTISVTEGEAVEWLKIDDCILNRNFVNYVTESSHYLYGRLLQEAENREVNFDVLDQYGWINDYYNVTEEHEYYADYTAADGICYTDSNSAFALESLLDTESEQQKTLLKNLKSSGIRGYLTMEFDLYGKIAEIEFISLGSLVYQANLYETARASLTQFQHNKAYYLEQAEHNGTDEAWAKRASEVIPKNFRIVFIVPANSSFVYNNSLYQSSFPSHENLYAFIDTETVFWDMGIFIVVMILAGFVALMALVLPFFKKLNTGWERLFCMPVEIVIGICLGGFLGAFLMFRIMCHSTLTEISMHWNNTEIMGYAVSNEAVHGLVLGVNFLAWALLFLAEYIVVASFRQFLCHPILYIKERFLVVMLLRWIFGQIGRFFRFMTDVNLSDSMHKDIFKVVFLNFCLVTIMCCGWFAGILLAALYSIIMYCILGRKGRQLQKQYNDILHATEQMAEGELKVSLSEDLGIFDELGRQLERIQDGFSKAVAEEAKSQHMKTELISNVSHDLKTPLTAIITYIDLLKQEGNTTEQQKSYIQTLEMKAQRLKVLIEDLFEVSKAQSGNIQLNRMDVDVVSLMKQMRLEMEDKIEESGLSFRWNLPEEKVILFLDGQKTYRIFENLLTNTLKYAMPQSRVYIDMINGEKEVQIIYKNVSATELSLEAEHLTERFVRGDASRNSEGSGLGLAIVKSFTEIQDGEFEIKVDGDLFKAVLTWKK